jgi:ribosomal protein L44E
MSKICSTCKIEKELDMFPAEKRYAGGYRPQCKDCRNNYWNVNTYPKRKANPQYRENQRKSQKLYVERNPEKALAHRLAKQHKNEVMKKACESCGVATGLHMHHPDYAKPLEVVTLCVPCHEAVHHRGALV